MFTVFGIFYVPSLLGVGFEVYRYSKKVNNFPIIVPKQHNNNNNNMVDRMSVSVQR